jgi:hypothetical protein
MLFPKHYLKARTYVIRQRACNCPLKLMEFLRHHLFILNACVRVSARSFIRQLTFSALCVVENEHGTGLDNVVARAVCCYDRVRSADDCRSVREALASLRTSHHQESKFRSGVAD